MKKRIRHNNSPISQMNVVPYIDVMLVLLIIFMATAPLFVPSVINLPQVGQASQISIEPIEISITKDGHYTISQHGNSQYSNDLNHLLNQVQSLSNTNTPIVISADKETEYNNVIMVVDKLYSAGIKKVALVVKESK